MKDSVFRDIYVDSDRPLFDRNEAYKLRQKLKQLRSDQPGKRIYIRQRKLLADDIEVGKKEPLKHAFPHF